MGTTTSTWNGSNADWATPDDWTPQGTPDSSTAQAVVNAGTVTVAPATSYALDVLTIDGASALVSLEGTLTFADSTDHAIMIEQGTLAINGAGTLLGTPDVTLDDGGTLDLSAATSQDIVIGGLNDDGGTIILGNEALLIGADNADSTLSGLIETGTAAQGGLIDQIGTGTLTLDNAVMNPGTNNSGLYITTGSLLENTGSSSIFYLAVGEGADNAASATLSGGTLSIGNGNPNGGGALQVGDFGGTGSFTQTGGLLDLVGSLNIGNEGGTGTYAISGGTLSLEGGTYNLGHDAGTYSASEGILSISGTGLVDVAAGELIIGDNVSSTGGDGNGTIVQTGGTLEIDAGTGLYLAAYGDGTYDLNGGTLAIGGSDLHGVYNAHGGTYAFNLGGGTIAVTGSALTTSDSITLASGTTSTLNLNGLGATFTGAITGSGNLDITGTGVASFADLDTTGEVDLQGSTLASTGVANSISFLVVDGGTPAGLSISAGDTLSLTTDTSVANALTVTNGSSLDITGGGTLFVGPGAGSVYAGKGGTGSASSDGSITLDGSTSLIFSPTGYTDLVIGHGETTEGTSGTFTQTDSSKVELGSNALIGVDGGVGTYTLSGDASLTTDSGTFFYIGLNQSVGSFNTATSGTLEITGNASFDFSGSNLEVGTFESDGATGPGGRGTIIQSGSAQVTLGGQYVFIGNSEDSDGVYDLEGGSLTVSNGNGLIVGVVAGATGDLDQTGGTLIVESSLVIGAQGTGTYELSNGLLEVGGSQLQGNGTFNLGNGTIAVTGSALSTGITTALQAGTSATLDLNGLGAAFTGAVSGSGSLDITGAGTASFANLDTTGTVTLNGNTLNLTGAADEIGTLNGTGTVTLDGTTLDLSSGAGDQIDALDGTGTIILGNAVLQLGGDDANSTFSGLIETGTTELGGLIDKIGTGSLTLDNVVMNAGTDNSGLYIVGGSLIESSGSSSLFYLAVGEQPGNTGTASLSGGSLTVGGASPVAGDASGALQIGDWGGTGVFDQTGGTLTIAAGSSLNIGNQGGSGSYLISAGTLSFQGGVFDIGRQQNGNVGSTGTLAISGGLVDIASGQLVLGSQYTPSKPGSSGTITQTGGDLRIESGTNFYLTGQPGSQGLYDLDGGTLEIGGTSLGTGGGTYAFNLGGGTIAIIGSTLETNASATLTTGTTSTLSLAGLGADFSGAITGSGNLDITGAGTASFANLDTTGEVTLNGNTLDLTGSTDTIGTLNGSGTVVLGHATLAIGSATGNFDFNGSGTASFASLIDTSGTITLDGNTLDLSGVSGGLAELGAIDGSGTIILGNTGLAVGIGTDDSTLSGLIETGTAAQGGAIDQYGSGTLTLDNAVMNPGTGSSGLYITTGSLLENTGSSSIFYLAVGEGADNAASATLSGGTLSIGNGDVSGGGALQVGDFGGTGSFTQTGGLLDLVGSLNVGNEGGTGTYAISGGTLSLEGGTYNLGHDVGTYSASEGILSISGTGLVDVAAGELIIGDNVSSTGGYGNGTIVQTGGTLEVDAGASLYLAAYGNGTYDLDGGTLAVGGSSLHGVYNAHGGTYAFNLGGGTIAVTNSALSTSDSITLASGTASTLDLNGLGATFTGAITGSGNLDITGAGTASFADLDTAGTVTLNGNTLDLGNSTIGDLALGLGQSGTVFVQAGETLSLSGLSLANGTSLVLTGMAVANASSLVNAGSLTLDSAALSETGTFVNNGVVTLDPSSLVVGALTGTGTVTIDSGSALDVEGAVSAGQTIAFSGTDGVLELGATNDIVLGTIANFGTADTIDLTGLAYQAGATASLDGDILTIVDGSTTLHLNLISDTPYTGLYFHVGQDGDGTSVIVNDEPPCFCAGTQILTDRGEVAVEDLRIGDRLVTLSGDIQPVRWIGRSTVTPRFMDPLRVAPVRIRAGALGAGLPVRDLRLSPCHAVLIDGLLVQANALVNGRSIVQETTLPERFVYYHVELETHTLLFADGVPSESFVDNVSRVTFDNWDEYCALGLDQSIEEMSCPRVQSRRQVPSGMQAMLDRQVTAWLAASPLARTA